MVVYDWKRLRLCGLIERSFQCSLTYTRSNSIHMASRQTELKDVKCDARLFEFWRRQMKFYIFSRTSVPRTEFHFVPIQISTQRNSFIINIFIAHLQIRVNSGSVIWTTQKNEKKGMKTNCAIYLRVKCFFHLTHFQNGPQHYSFENLLTRRRPYLFNRVTINTFVWQFKVLSMQNLSSSAHSKATTIPYTTLIIRLRAWILNTPYATRLVFIRNFHIKRHAHFTAYISFYCVWYNKIARISFARRFSVKSRVKHRRSVSDYVGLLGANNNAYNTIIFMCGRVSANLSRNSEKGLIFKNF